MFAQLGVERSVLGRVGVLPEADTRAVTVTTVPATACDDDDASEIAVAVSLTVTVTAFDVLAANVRL